MPLERAPGRKEGVMAAAVCCLSVQDIVLASHLRPLERKDKIGGKRNQPWNSYATEVVPKHDSVVEIAKEFCSEPKTAAEFYRDWRRCLKDGVERYQFLLQLGAATISRIFHADIAFGLLGEMVNTLAENVQSTDYAAVFQILQSLSGTCRFNLNLDFLSTAEKESCLKLFQKLKDRELTTSTSARLDTDQQEEVNGSMGLSQDTDQNSSVDHQELGELMARYKVM
ncbi:coiled-coil domain-containing protein 103 isoform X2 [Pleurodeles waltl]|uniref:coiled-coil domain-containing protein 103 isoform X2 n=1 Tax=Pleurodeles waltl TaxID=8319 RepID=UPI00370991EF